MSSPPNFLSFSPVVSAISLLVSVTVAWLTLFRRGALHMTRPVQIAFVFENLKPKVFLRTLLYTTGKRGYVTRGALVESPARRLWAYIWILGIWGAQRAHGCGLRVTDGGFAYNHHFLQSSESDDFHFSEGEYEIKVYARVVNRRSAKLLSRVELTLPKDAATRMYLETSGVLFTWNPDTQTYNPTLSPER